MNAHLDRLEQIIAEMEERARRDISQDAPATDAFRLIAFAKRVMKVGRGQFVNFWAEELLETLEEPP
jgi:hypothetical protein